MANLRGGGESSPHSDFYPACGVCKNGQFAWGGLKKLRLYHIHVIIYGLITKGMSIKKILSLY